MSILDLWIIQVIAYCIDNVFELEYRTRQTRITNQANQQTNYIKPPH